MNNRLHTRTKRLRLIGFRLLFLLCINVILLACVMLQATPTPTPPPTPTPSKRPPEITTTSVIKASQIAPTAAASTPSPQPVVTLTTKVIWASGTETAVYPTVSGTYREPYWFSDQDCSCASFPATVDASYGPGYLECNYRWSGKYIDDNALSFIIQQYQSSTDLEPEFSEQIGWIYDSAQVDKDMIDAGSLSGHEQYIARNETNGFTYVTTGPGGGSSKTQGEIPMCGNGSGIIRAPDDYLVEIRLFACDLGDDRLVYQTAIETLEDCALSNIERAMTTTP